MSYRIYDTERKEWIKDGVYSAPNGDLYKPSKSLFGKPKMILMDKERFVYHKFVDLYDKNNIPVFAGDYLEATVAEDRVVRGVVTYAIELSAYIILCFDENEYFTLGSEVCQFLEVIGNVFDGFDDEERENQ